MTPFSQACVAKLAAQAMHSHDAFIGLAYPAIPQTLSTMAGSYAFHALWLHLSLLSSSQKVSSNMLGSEDDTSKQPTQAGKALESDGSGAHRHL